MAIAILKGELPRFDGATTNDQPSVQCHSLFRRVQDFEK